MFHQDSLFWKIFLIIAEISEIFMCFENAKIRALHSTVRTIFFSTDIPGSQRG